MNTYLIYLQGEALTVIVGAVIISAWLWFKAR